jgi:uncharacterized protein YcbK (DUF882 family)
MSLGGASSTRARRLGRRSVLAALGAVGLAAVPAWARSARERRVHLVCPETGEAFDGVYWQDGQYLPEAMRRINWLMRDFHCDAVAKIDPSLVDLLHGVTLNLGTRRPISVLSGYRTPSTNIELRHEGRPAAPHSQHLVARAADIAVEGIGVARLHRAAGRLNHGGIGLYRGYIHIDTGPVRDWHDYQHQHHHHAA